MCSYAIDPEPPVVTKRFEENIKKKEVEKSHKPPICNARPRFPNKRNSNYIVFFLRKIPARSSTIGILEIRYLPCSACGGDERFARRETISVLAGVDSLVFSEKEEFVDTCSKTSAEDRSKP